MVALTLLRTQRLDAMELQRVLLLCNERWLARNESVPLVVRQARFVLARSTVGKLSALLSFHFDTLTLFSRTFTYD